MFIPDHRWHLHTKPSRWDLPGIKCLGCTMAVKNSNCKKDIHLSKWVLSYFISLNVKAVAIFIMKHHDLFAVTLAILRFHKRCGINWHFCMFITLNTTPVCWWTCIFSQLRDVVMKSASHFQWIVSTAVHIHGYYQIPTAKLASLRFRGNITAVLTLANEIYMRRAERDICTWACKADISSHLPLCLRAC